MLFPTLSPGSSAVKQENTRSIYRVILKIMAGGGGFDFFGQDPKFSFWTILDHFGPFFVMDDLDSSNFAREWHQSSPGSATKQTKIQVVAVFTGFLTKFGCSGLKN